MPNPSAYIQSISALRGIAALFVCVLHFSIEYTPSIGEEIAHYTRFVENGYLWVDFFFILSGFVLTHVYHQQFANNKIDSASFKKFMWARFARIYPLHFFILMVLLLRAILLFAYVILLNGVEDTFSNWGVDGMPFAHPDTLFNLLRNLLLIQSISLDPADVSWNYPAWSIGTEWFSYMLIPLWIKLFHLRLMTSQNLARVLTAGAFGSILFLWFLGSFSDYDLDMAGIPGLLRCVVESLIGIALYVVFVRQSGRSWLGRESVIAGLFLLIIAGMHYNFIDAFVVILFALVILAVIYSDGFFGRWLNCRPLVYLGVISYSVYLTHTVVRYVIVDVASLVFNVNIGSDFSSSVTFLFFVFALLGVLLVSAFTYAYIEKPARNWLVRNKRFPRRQTVDAVAPVREAG